MSTGILVWAKPASMVFSASIGSERPGTKLGGLSVDSTATATGMVSMVINPLMGGARSFPRSYARLTALRPYAYDSNRFKWLHEKVWCGRRSEGVPNFFHEVANSCPRQGRVL